MRTFILFLIPVFASAEIVTTSGVWEKDSALKELYPSPLGCVYKFSKSDNTSILIPTNASSSHSKNCSCVTCRYRKQTIDGGLLELGLPRKKKNSKKQFFVVDFKIRCFPALSKNPTSTFSFLFIDSERKIRGATYPELHGMLHIQSFTLNFEYSTNTHGPIQDKTCYSILRPEFEPLSIRVVYDMKNGAVSYYANNEFQDFRKISNYEKPLSICYFGITTVASKYHRTEYFEISSPTIYQFDDIEELKSLPAMAFSPYPYENYQLETRKKIRTEDDLFPSLKRNKNSDLQYAYALRYLYGPEKQCSPGKGIELLKKASEDHHVLALYQLGVCYFRGYGVEPDTRKALKYLEEAHKLGYETAGALQWFIAYDSANHPWFTAKKLNDMRKTIKVNGGIPDHDYAFTGIPSVFNTRMGSPKLLIDSLYSTSYVRKNSISGNQKYVDYVIQSGEYPNAYWSKAIRGGLLDQEKILAHLQAGVAAGDRMAWPDMILWKLKNKKSVLPDEFSPLTDYLYSDNPLYCILSLVLKNNRYEDLIAFTSGFSGAIVPTPMPESLNLLKTPESELLRGLLILHNFCFIRNAETKEVVSELEEAFLHIRNAADQNNPMAQYWMGRFYYYNDLPKKYQVAENQAKENARAFLKKAFDNGYTPASILLAELELSQTTQNLSKILECLEYPCKLEYPPAVFLKSEVLYRLNKNQEACALAQLAAEKGDPQGWRSLALFAEKQNKSEVADKYWFKFITADRNARKMNRFDPYWPDLYAEFDKWENPVKQEPAEKSQVVPPKKDQINVQNNKVSLPKIRQRNSQKKKGITIRDDD